MKPLKGIRVFDFLHCFQAPATLMLADAGEKDKIEKLGVKI